MRAALLIVIRIARLSQEDGPQFQIHSGFLLQSNIKHISMIRSTIECGSSLFNTEYMVENGPFFTDGPQYDWQILTMRDGPDDPDPKTAKQARVVTGDGPDEEDPQQAKNSLSCFFGMTIYRTVEISGPRTATLME
ncbi:hypothetical protein B0T20DRAFT_483020 [Sordaria brevicollis]|uniref:Uncharacterized protein n=1 Tax=Sordaria brevicollis TaxID=83679 RepID=A0AAE0P1Y8_SORBR|nr:hypothetical protein B0T20DRAFT_483020 [Sordaria brevicollis]